MRIVVFIAAICVSVVNLCAKSKIEKNLSVIDVYESVMQSDTANLGSFWKELQDTNLGYRRVAKSKSKSRKDKDVKKFMEEADVFQEILSQKCITENEEVNTLLESLLEASGIRAFNDRVKLFLLPDPSVNAYSCPGGYIFFTTGLLSRLNDFDALLGVLCHECTHYVLQHSYSNELTEKREKKRNQLLAGIAMGLEGAVDMTTAVVTNSTINQPAAKRKYDYLEARYNLTTEINVLKSMLKYSRQNEYESDLVAYRYLQWRGLDAYRIMRGVLISISDESNAFDDPNSDHPSVTDRIALLKYVDQNVSNPLSNKARAEKERQTKFDGIYFGSGAEDDYY